MNNKVGIALGKQQGGHTVVRGEQQGGHSRGENSRVGIAWGRTAGWACCNKG